MGFKYEEVKEKLMDMVTALHDEGARKIPSEGQLRDELGVSVSVIRQAVKNLETEGIITKVQGSGSYINHEYFRKKTRGIYLFAFGVHGEHPYFRHIVKLSYPPVLRDGFDFLLRPVSTVNQGNPHELFDMELARIKNSRNIDCIFALSCHLDRLMVEKLQSLGKPVVFVDSFADASMNSLELPLVWADNAHPARESVRYLSRKGHRKIALLTRDPTIFTYQHFIDGARDSAALCGVDLIPVIIPAEALKEGGGVLVEDEEKAMFSAFEGCSAILTYAVSAPKFLTLTRKYSIDIPGKISVLAANEDISELSCLNADYSPFFNAIFDLAETLLSGDAAGRKSIEAEIDFIDHYNIKDISI